MQAIINNEDLKNAIRLAEERQSINGKLLKKQILITCESLKPEFLIMSAVRDVTSGPNLIKSVAGTALGLTTRYLSKKIVFGTSAKVLGRILAGILPFITTNIFSRNAGAIGRVIQQSLSKKNIP
jgi:hypothetical protein